MCICAQALPWKVDKQLISVFTALTVVLPGVSPEGSPRLQTGAIQMQHFDAFGVGFCDSSVRWVPLHLEEKETRALLTIAGGEAVNFDWKKESGQGQ